MKVFYIKSTVDEDYMGRQTRNEKRTDWSFGLKTTMNRGGNAPTLADLETDYDLVYDSSLDETSGFLFDQVFERFQGEFMTDSIRRQVFRVRDRSHTSMSVGDIVIHDGKVWFCDSYGFTPIHEVS